MGSLCSKENAAAPERSAEPVRFLMLTAHIVSCISHNDSHCFSRRSLQYKAAEPRRPVEAEGSASGKPFSELYRLGKQVRCGGHLLLSW